MNNKQQAKYDNLKKALMAVSFDWTTAIYKRNGDVVFEGDLLFTHGLDVWCLSGNRQGLLVLSHGDKSKTIGFIEEYNTSDAHTFAHAETVDRKVRQFLSTLSNISLKRRKKKLALLRDSCIMNPYKANNRGTQHESS